MWVVVSQCLLLTEYFVDYLNHRFTVIGLDVRNNTRRRTVVHHLNAERRSKRLRNLYQRSSVKLCRFGCTVNQVSGQTASGNTVLTERAS